MRQFGIMTLLLGTCAAACLASFVSRPAIGSFLAISTLLPFAIGLHRRYVIKVHDDSATAITIASGILVGSILMTCGFLVQAITPASHGATDGFDWYGTGAALFSGAFGGLLAGVVAAMLYQIAVAVVSIRRDRDGDESA